MEGKKNHTIDLRSLERVLRFVRHHSCFIYPWPDVKQTREINASDEAKKMPRK